MGVMQDKGKPVLLGARLKLVNGKIAEIDHMVSPLNEPLPAGLVKPRPGLITKIADSERVSREQMLKAANAYYEASSRVTATPHHSPMNASVVKTA